MPDDPVLTGGCGCGAVRFELSAPLQRAAYCHCTRCQHRTGTAAQASGLAAPGSFAVTQGGEHLSRWAPEGGFEKVFCAECGSHLYGEHPEDRDVVTVRLGAIEGDPGIRPQAHQFVAYAAVWEPIPDDGLPRFDERAPAA